MINVCIQHIREFTSAYYTPLDHKIDVLLSPHIFGTTFQLIPFYFVATNCSNKEKGRWQRSFNELFLEAKQR